MPLRTPLSDRNRRPTGGSSRSRLPCVKSRVRNLLHSVNSTTASDEEAIDNIEEISHPEEAAKQLSRRTHNGIPADRRFPYTLGKPGPTALGARTVHRSVSHCYRLSGRSRRRDGSRRSSRNRQNIWVSPRPPPPISSQPTRSRGGQIAGARPFRRSAVGAPRAPGTTRTLVFGLSADCGAAGGYRTYDLSLTKGVLYH